MHVYLVESFLPAERAAAVREAARYLPTSGPDGQVLHLLALPGSQLCLWVVEASSHEAATAAVRRAGLTVDSLPELVEVFGFGADNRKEKQ